MPLDFDGQRVRVVMVKGEPWWYATDVCKVLGIGNAPQAVSYLDDDERTTITTNDSGQTRNFMLVNESGLYSLIFRSRKPEAKRFQDWVCEEVLPAIRKTGSYQMGRIAKTAKRLKSNIPTATARPAPAWSVAGRLHSYRPCPRGALRRRQP
jgi:prophage antirepressor-like protein